jgi:hypothetical protein
MYSTAAQTEPKLIATIFSQNKAQWILYNITVPNMPPNFRFMLKTIEGNLSRSDVAVDDIQVFSGECDKPSVPTTLKPITPTQSTNNETQWDCDFETANCKWTPDMNWNKTQWINGMYCTLFGSSL